MIKYIRVLLVPILMLMLTIQLSATHNRAGEITYKQIGQNEIELTVTVYATGKQTADATEVDVSWGDGTISELKRVIYVSVAPNIQKKVYVGTHRYPGPNPVPGQPYLVSMDYPNRNNSILNINSGNSKDISFFLQTEVFLFTPSTFGYNSSPILLEDPIDYGIVGEVFQHTPNAFDPDGDSISYELVTPLQALNQVVSNYQPVTAVNPSVLNTFTFDAATGLFTWDAPQRVGVYNIAILVKTYRNGTYIGSVLRDIQINIVSANNRPPEIDVVEELCVVAGELINLPVSVSDPDAGQLVSTTATGGVLLQSTSNNVNFQITSPGQGTTQNPLVGTLTWQTSCSDIQETPHQIVFKAKDNFTINGNDRSLATFKVLRIRVIAPPPANLQAVVTGNVAALTWDSPYLCQDDDVFLGFSVWRKEGCDNFVPDTCEIGLAGKGYTKISTSLVTQAGGNVYQFDDNTIQKGLSYSYRVLAELATPVYYNGQVRSYHSLVSSLSSDEICIETKEDLPRFINVDVLKTDKSQGEIFVRWIKSNVEAFDTTVFIPPYKYELYASEGQDGGNFGTTPVFSSPSYSAFYLSNDTFFTHKNINTATLAHSYKIVFYSGNDTVGESKIASSVFLTVTPSDAKNTLSWTANVPWTNSTYVVYELFNGGRMILDTVSTPAFTHLDLINGNTYCYVIEALGAYNRANTPDTLFNFSEEACGTPADSIAPCPPTGIIGITGCSAINDDTQKPDRSPCQGNILAMEELYNEIKWSAKRDSCSQDVAKYKVYFSPYCTEEYSLVYESDDNLDTSYIHYVNAGENLSGCYYITSVDSIEVNGGGNESDSSAIIITDNCPFYELPNTFTPNSDGQNDLFGPCLNLRYIKEVDFKVTNRWGQIVFATTDPAINWDGKDMNTGADLAEGVYFYTCQIVQDCINCSPVEPINGFVHIIRGKK